MVVPARRPGTGDIGRPSRHWHEETRPGPYNLNRTEAAAAGVLRTLQITSIFQVPME